MNWYSSVERFLKSQERIHMQRVPVVIWTTYSTGWLRHWARRTDT